MPIRACASGSRSGLLARAALPWVQQPAGTCPNSWRDGFARDCPLRHPVAAVLALRDHSAATPSLSVDFGRFSAVTGAVPAGRDAPRTNRQPVCEWSSREPVSMVPVVRCVRAAWDREHRAGARGWDRARVVQLWGVAVLHPVRVAAGRGGDHHRGALLRGGLQLADTCFSGLRRRLSSSATTSSTRAGAGRSTACRSGGADR